VLRRGVVVGSWDRGEADAAGMARAMVGRDVHIERRAPADRVGDVALELRGVSVFAGERPVLDGVDLTVRSGEIHGIAGVDGNGQDELVDVVLGIRSVDAGSVHLAALAADPAAGERYDVRSFLRSGGAVVPADRHRYGVAADMSVATNLTLNKVVWGDGAVRGVLQGRRLERWAGEAADRFDVRVPSLDLPVAALSGGNQQKVVLAREIGRDPDVLVAAQPTRGLDVGAVQAVYAMLGDYVARGGAVLLISAELDELLTLADRISVMTAGRLSEPIPAASFDRGRIGLMMAGERA
jgi:simple sugar transport system ATP-binding protein